MFVSVERVVSPVWNGDELDLDEYLGFIGFDGDRTPNPDTLRRLQRGHVLSVKWENLDAYLRKRVALDLPALQEKLLRSPRGGYCYEHVTLFGAALERLGFDFFGIEGRVQMGATTIRPATHAMLVVRLGGGLWLADVGFGASPLQPVELVDEALINDDAWAYLLRRGEVTPGASGWILSEAAADGTAPGWLSRHTFVLQPRYPIDFRVGNYFVANSPQSPFSTRLYVQRQEPDRRWIIDHRTLHTVHPGVGRESRELSPDEVLVTLRETFGIELSTDDSALLRSAVARR